MKVTIITADDERRTIELRGERIRVGRSRSNEICLLDAYVSRAHAELARTAEGWTIRDVGSRGGTYLNGVRVTAPTPVHEGDIVQLGNSALAFGEAAADGSVTLSETAGAATVHTYRSADTSPRAFPRVVVRAVRELAHRGPSDTTLRDILRMAVEAVDGDRGALALAAPDGSLRIKSAVPWEKRAEIVIPSTVHRRVLEAGEAVFAEDVSADRDMAAARSVVSQGIRSFYCAPVGYEEEVRGILYIDTRSHRAHFHRSQLELVATLASFIGIALEFERARRVEERNRRMQAELSAAAEIQERLLPGEHPRLAEGFVVAAHHRACHTVGGDLYDVWQPSPATAGIMVADVAGKGLGAALITSSLHALWYGARTSDLPPERWLPRINERLRPLIPENRFATIAFALVDAETDRLRLAGAGHTPALLLSGGRVEVLRSLAPAVGLFPDFDCPIAERPFRSGDLLLLCSDGALDQRDPGGDPFGEGRLLERFRQLAPRGPEELVEGMTSAIEEHAGGAEQDDDLTLVALARS
ncbi:MAG: FHA domain-containing protein [Acidobacteria bacterium]|nr:MAG: FHA domain-containing protein [Acidobacteriota bacterium]